MDRNGTKTIRANTDRTTLGLACAASALAFLSLVSNQPHNWQIAIAIAIGGAVVALGARILVIGVRRREARRERDGLIEKVGLDPLTGCHSRPGLVLAMRRYRDAPGEQLARFATLVFDIDGFKDINDGYGNPAGDHMLRTVAGRVREAMPGGSTLARFAGDEFAAILPYDPAATNDPLTQIGNALLRAISAPIDIEGTTIRVSASMGIAPHDPELFENDDAAGPATLLRRASLAMYHAKKQGKNCHRRFCQSMESAEQLSEDLEARIRIAVKNDEFVPYYEQQVDLETGRLVGFEMLARWISPELGVVGPDLFIPVAERAGMIGALSEGLMRAAFADARGWHPDLTLSVNISPIQLRDPWFSQRLLALLHETGFPPQRLDIEITESCLHENTALVRTTIAGLHNLGISISLDDFGTGYAGLAHLRALPFDRIKIDRSFVGELAQDKDQSESIVNAIYSLGRGLDLPITAEGIENSGILESLRRIGGMKGQGYLYGRPEDARSVKERLGAAGLLAGDQAAGELPSIAPQIVRSPILDRKAG